MIKLPENHTGQYQLRTMRFPFPAARLVIPPVEENEQPCGWIRLVGRRVPLRLHRVKRDRLLFLLSAGPFDLELEIHFRLDGSLSGFLDTPIGLIPLKGHRLGDRTESSGEELSAQPEKPVASSRRLSNKCEAMIGPDDASAWAHAYLPTYPMNKCAENGLYFNYLQEEEAFLCLPFGIPYLGDRLRARIGKHLAIPGEVRSHQAIDAFGACKRFDIRYQSPVNPDRAFLARVFLHEGFALFESEQLFSVEGKEGKNPFGFPYIGFPSFEGACWQDGFSILTYKRQAPFQPPLRWRGRLCDSFREGRNLPLIATDDAFRTIVMSPLSPLLQATVSIRHTPPEIRCGLSRSLRRLPAGTICRTLLVWGTGVNATLEHWGSLLRKYHDVNSIAPDADVLLEKLSYWTNAGSAYWYNTFKKTSYEETLRKLRERHDALGLKFGSYQLDSWWYRREHEGYTGGIMEWAPRKETARRNYNSPLSLREARRIPLFEEDRLSRAQEILDSPLGCHFKQIANSSPMVTSDPEAFLCEDFALPSSESHATLLFQQLFTHPRWRLAYVVHDWLQWMSDRHSAFRDPDIGPGYFRALDKVLQDIPTPDNHCGHVTLQLCMTQPSMTLNAVSMPSVTTIRSTPDSFSFFVEGPKRWWWHLFSGRLIEVIGKHAFYDNRPSGRRRFWSRPALIELELRWLCLSGGPLGLGDAIGRENPERVARCALQDGTLLKPFSPAKPLDRCFLMPNLTEKNVPHGMNAAALSRTGLIISARDEVCLNGLQSSPYDVLYLLGIGRDASGKRAPIRFALREAGARANHSYALLHLPSLESELVDPDAAMLYLTKGYGFMHCLAAPLLGGLAFFGDISKHVSAARLLIQEIQHTPGHWRIHGRFAENAASRWVFHCSCMVGEAKLDGISIPLRWIGQTLVLESDTTQVGTYVLDIHTKS